MSRGCENRGHLSLIPAITRVVSLGKILIHCEPQFPFRKCKDNHFHFQNHHEDELR